MDYVRLRLVRRELTYRRRAGARERYARREEFIRSCDSFSLLGSLRGMQGR